MKKAYKTFELKGFTLKSGVVLDLKLAYQTYGKLNKEKSNVILFPTHFAGKHTDNEWLIGDGKALDTSKYFIIVPNLFGNGLSSSPSNTKGIYGGSQFPQTDIQDNVIAQYNLLTQYFKIKKINLAIGYSLGATQVYNWAHLFPEMISKMVIYAGGIKASDQFNLIKSASISILEADVNNINKESNTTGVIGKGNTVRLMAKAYIPWIFSHKFFKDSLYSKRINIPTIKHLMDNIELSFLEYTKEDLGIMLLTENIVSPKKTDDSDRNHKNILSRIKAKVLLMPCKTDLLFPIEDSYNEAKFISNVEVAPIPSLWGHAAGIGMNSDDNYFISQNIQKLLCD